MTCWTVPRWHGLSLVLGMIPCGCRSWATLCLYSTWLLQMALPADYLPMHATSTFPPLEMCMQSLMNTNRLRQPGQGTDASRIDNCYIHTQFYVAQLAPSLTNPQCLMLISCKSLRVIKTSITMLIDKSGGLFRLSATCRTVLPRMVTLMYIFKRRSAVAFGSQQWVISCLIRLS